MRHALNAVLLVWSATLLMPACAPRAIEPLQLEGNRLTVTNQTPDDWRDVELWLNSYFRLTVRTIAAHGRFDATLDSFVTGYARRFDFYHSQVRSLRLAARRPDGRPVAIEMTFRASSLAGALGEKR